VSENYYSSKANDTRALCPRPPLSLREAVEAQALALRYALGRWRSLSFGRTENPTSDAAEECVRRVLGVSRTVTDECRKFIGCDGSIPSGIHSALADDVSAQIWKTLGAIESEWKREHWEAEERQEEGRRAAARQRMDVSRRKREEAQSARVRRQEAAAATLRSVVTEDDFPKRLDEHVRRMQANYPQIRIGRKQAIRSLLHKALKAEEQQKGLRK
jgi:hypothetical protein